MGRPKSMNPKGRVVQLRMTGEDYDLISRAAARCGMSVSAFIRGQCKSAAVIILGGEK